MNSAVAADLQRQVQRLAKPWYRLRSLRVFRDDADLAAGPALWEPIEVALGESAHLVFLASSTASRSEWVRREIAWWLAHRGVESLIIGVVDGSIGWDDARGGFGAQTDCLPPDLLRAFPAEPHWVDLRNAGTGAAPGAASVSQAASIVAAITGRDKDEIIGEDVRQHRRTRRIAVEALALITVLAVVAVVAAIQATGQRNSAIRSATVARAHALAAQSAAERGQGLQRSLLYAAAARSQRSDTASQAALLGALSFDPHLVRFVSHPADVRAQVWLPTTQTLAEGGDGYLDLTVAGTGAVRRVPMAGSVVSLAGTADGRTVVTGSDDGQLSEVDVSSGVREWTRQLGSARVVAVGVRGGTVAVLTTDSVLQVRELSSGLPRSPGSTTRIHVTDPVFLSFSPDGGNVIVGDSLGSVSRWTVADLSEAGPASELAGPADTLPPSSYVVSDRSVTFGYPNRGLITVKTVLGTAVNVRFPSTVISDSSAFAMSANRQRAAVDADGTLRVLEAADAAHPDGAVTDLGGVSAVDTRLSFSADGQLLASATGPNTAIWRPDGTGGIVDAASFLLPSTCFACGAAGAAVDPNAGTLVAFRYGGPTGNELVCWDPATRRVLTDTPVDSAMSSLSVSKDGSRLVGTDEQGIRYWPMREGCPVNPAVRLPVAFDGGQDTSDQALELLDGSWLVSGFAGSLAHVSTTGAILQQVPQKDFAGPASVRAVATTADGYGVVVGQQDGSVVSYRPTSSSLGQVWSTPATGRQIVDLLSISATQLAVSDISGAVVVLDAGTGRLVRRLAGAQGYALAAPRGTGLLVAVTGRQDTAAVWQLSDGALLSTIGFAPVAPAPGTALREARSSSRFATTLAADAAGGVWFVEAGIVPTRWDLQPSHWSELACAQGGRRLTADEWLSATGSPAPASLPC